MKPPLSTDGKATLAAWKTLRRFVREYVETFPMRRERQSHRLLEKAFQNAPSWTHRRVPPSTLLERRQQLERRYSLSAAAPASEEILIVRKSAIPLSGPVEQIHNGELDNTTSVRSGDDDGDNDPQQHEQAHTQHQHVTFEVVVQHLYRQLESLRDQHATKDRRIAELEALVMTLATENLSLRNGKSSTATTATAHSSTSNQNITV